MAATFARARRQPGLGSDFGVRRHQLHGRGVFGSELSERLGRASLRVRWSHLANVLGAAGQSANPAPGAWVGSRHSEWLRHRMRRTCVRLHGPEPVADAGVLLVACGSDGAEPADHEATGLRRAAPPRAPVTELVRIPIAYGACCTISTCGQRPTRGIATRVAFFHFRLLVPVALQCTHHLGVVVQKWRTDVDVEVLPNFRRFFA